MSRLSGRSVLLVFLPVALTALAGAIWAGLARMGWGWPLPGRDLLLQHGPLIVSGFLGTVIGVERAVALGAGWAYTAPGLAAAGAVFLICGRPQAGAALFAASALALCAVYAAAYRRQAAAFIVVMGVGAAAWAGGSFLQLAGGPGFMSMPWWIAFLVLTILGERLELSRLRPERPGQQRVFFALIGWLLASLLLSLRHDDIGLRLAGASLVGLAVWMWRCDIARATIRMPGLPRFSAAGLISGYVWLAVSGVLFAAYGQTYAGLVYDAQVHAVFIGFVISMVFAHAPIILPAVSGVHIPFRRRFYLHLILLHASLALRLAGDLAGQAAWRAGGGLLNAAAVALFLANTVWAARQNQIARSESA